MKVIIPFKAGKEKICFEAERYRENLKGSYSRLGMQMVDSVKQGATLAHFISPTEESEANDAYLDDLKVIISVGYAEATIETRFFDYSEDKPKPTRKTKRMLKQADLVLVPNQMLKKLLELNGVEAPIEVVTAGVDKGRFEGEGSPNEELFLHYARLPKGVPYIVAVGDIDSETDMETMKALAKEHQDVLFYYVTYSKKVRESIEKAKWSPKGIHGNLIVTSPVADDIYRSAIKGALAYVSLPNGGYDSIGILEAMAAKTPVIYMDERRPRGIYKDKETVYVASNTGKAIRRIGSLLAHETPSVVDMAYDYATDNDLDKMAAQLGEAISLIMPKKK